MVSDYASDHGYVIVTKDADFAEFAQASGSALKVIWLRLGNCTTEEIEAALARSGAAILRLGYDPEARVLSIE